MRKITAEVVGAFNNKEAKRMNNTESTGEALYLHGNKIAEYRDGDLWITNAGWMSNTTKERLNGIEGVSVHQKKGVWYLNDVEWDGEWIKVESGLRASKHYKAMTPYMATGLAEGFEKPDMSNGEEDAKEQVLSAWQFLHDTGAAYQLQGWFGRTAQDLISQGVIEA